jgi:hypothetical protein
MNSAAIHATKTSPHEHIGHRASFIRGATFSMVMGSQATGQT